MNGGPVESRAAQQALLTGLRDVGCQPTTLLAVQEQRIADLQREVVILQGALLEQHLDHERQRNLWDEERRVLQGTTSPTSVDGDTEGGHGRG